MLNVYTPHGSAGNGRPTVSDGERAERIGSIEHHLCGAGGLLLAIVLTALFYPLLVSLTLGLEMLATTALVSAVVLVWCLAWIGLELLWGWHVGRRSA